MRALVVHQHGPLDQLKLENFPDPRPGPDEVLIEVHAASINFPDLLVIGGTYQNLPPTPFVPGKDLCCSVVESIEQALADPHFKARGLFDRKLTADGKSIAALPVPIADEWRGAGTAGYPALGEANSLLAEDKNH